jgi:hypothetical protein
MGDNATGHCEPEGLRLMVDMAPEASPLSPDRSHQRVRTHAGHRREVDHQASVTQRVPGYGVSPTSDRYWHLALPTEAHGGDYVSSSSTARDHGRFALDISVPDLLGSIEAFVARFEHFSYERFDLHHDLPPSDVSNRSIVMRLLSKKKCNV